MKVGVLATVAAAVILLRALGASAEEESEKVRKARYETELEKEADRVKEKCGISVEVAIEWAGFDADPAWKERSVSSFCDSALGAIATYCSGENARAYVQKKVKKLVCKAAKTKADWRLSWKGAVLEWAVPPDASNADAFAAEQVLRVL